jgi:hypothetical protein
VTDHGTQWEDLVERLRGLSDYGECSATVAVALKDAADEIERLREVAKKSGEPPPGMLSEESAAYGRRFRNKELP